MFIPEHNTESVNMDRDSSAGIATLYGMNGPEIESWLRGARFSAPVQTGPGAHPASYTMSTGSFLRVKLLGRGFDNPLPSRAEVKEIYSYASAPPLGPRGLFEGEPRMD
jgi:hypothetical protein